MPTRILVGALALSGALAFAQTKPQPGVEVQMILTVADHMNHHPGPLNPEDITIEDATITHWVPFRDGRNLELFILIDDAANYDFASKLDELREFVSTQPAGESIGVAYIHDGVLRVELKPTTDHRRVVRALRSPAGSTAANPYCAISDLIRNWTGGGSGKTPLRREIVLVSTGIDESADKHAMCVNAEGAIHDAEKAGVVVFSLYNPDSGYLAEDWTKADAGVIDLAHVSYETGGEAYFVGHGPVESIAPFLSDIAEHLVHQYLVTMRVSPGPESGFQKIQIVPGIPDLELMKPEGVWVPGPVDRREK